jgi:RNase P subunit RPR2
MKVHATRPTLSAAPDKLSENLPEKLMGSFCPACCDLMVAPALSQHVNDAVVSHWWACESCGHEFRTTVYLPASAEAWDAAAA